METLKELRDDIAAGKTTSVAAVEAFFTRIDQFEPTVGAYLSLCKEGALEQATAVDAKIAAGEAVGELAGVPVAVKDNMCTT